MGKFHATTRAGGGESVHNQLPVEKKKLKTFSTNEKKKLINYKTRVNLEELLSRLINQIGATSGGVYLKIETNQLLVQSGEIYSQLDLTKIEEKELSEGRCISFDHLYLKAIQTIGEVVVFVGLKINRADTDSRVKQLIKLYTTFMAKEFDISARALLLDYYSEKLDQRKWELEKTQNYNKHLLSITTHDLSSPLNAISGYLDLMNECLATDRDMNRLDKYHNQIKVGVGDLTNMLSQLSEVVHSGNEQEVHDLIKLDLNWVVNEVGEFLNPTAEKKGQSLLLSLHDEPVFVKGDLTKLKRILYNLISNAIKYTPESGMIRVNVYNDENGIGVSVSDNGIGISKEDREVVFEAFKKANGNESDSKNSFGLGLYISSVFAKIMGVSIELDSELGEGSMFTLRFPEHVSREVETRQAS